MPGLVAALTFVGLMLYSALRFTLERLLIPLSILYLSYLGIRSGNHIITALMVLAAIQWVRAERELKLTIKLAKRSGGN